jgi:hypothetical protein
MHFCLRPSRKDGSGSVPIGNIESREFSLKRLPGNADILHPSEWGAFSAPVDSGLDLFPFPLKYRFHGSFRSVSDPPGNTDVIGSPLCLYPKTNALYASGYNDMRPCLIFHFISPHPDFFPSPAQILLIYILPAC